MPPGGGRRKKRRWNRLELAAVWPDARDDLRPEGFSPVPELAWEIQHRAEPVQAVPESRTETKNRLKRRMYALLVCCTGRELPWVLSPAYGR